MGYKFYYFNARGRGETTRLILVAAGQNFEDVRFEPNQWCEHKPKSPSGQAPFLEIPEGKKLCQSRAIQRYLGNKFNLYGSNDLEKYTIDAVSDTISDLFQEYNSVRFTTDPAEKKKKEEAFYGTKGPDIMNLLQKFLSEGKPGTLAGGKLSWADLELFVAIEMLDLGGPESKALLQKYPSMLDHAKAIKALPKIAAYLAKRPVTSM